MNVKFCDFFKIKKLTKNIEKYNNILFNPEICHGSKNGNILNEYISQRFEKKLYIYQE